MGDTKSWVQCKGAHEQTCFINLAAAESIVFDVVAVEETGTSRNIVTIATISGESYTVETDKQTLSAIRGYLAKRMVPPLRPAIPALSPERATTVKRDSD